MLITPSNFARDPVGFIVNQFGHAAVGLTMVYMICLASLRIWGELPTKVALAVVVVSFYFFVIELWIQKWRGWDTVEDTLFVSYGATIPLLTFTESGPGVVIGYVDAAGGLFTWATVHLFVGAAVRAWRKWRGRP